MKRSFIVLLVLVLAGLLVGGALLAGPRPTWRKNLS
jgi:hypothetical protein